jgi:hydrogenase maturation protein HypF
MPCARHIRVCGIVQGVGFRPHVYRLAQQHRVTGWVVNGDRGVDIHVEGDEESVDAFIRELRAQPPPAARVQRVEVGDAPAEADAAFEIRASRSTGRPVTRISPDLPICETCLAELFATGDRRASYPYINCTDCGPRFSIVLALPYDRPGTTMAEWPMCPACARDYHDPADRRFHAQPVACPRCGPQYQLIGGPGHIRLKPDTTYYTESKSEDPIGKAAALLGAGCIVATKGIGGYHLACDAASTDAVAALRSRKGRREQAFALMVRDLAVARETCELTARAEALLQSAARPIVLAPARIDLPGVAPDNSQLGIMLPYAPVHHLLFARGAPDRLVMTSGNRSSEPIAFLDADAIERLTGLADAFLAGQRRIARRIDDSIVRDGALGPVVLRRSRGLAPEAVAVLPARRPMLALGGDLKNTVTLVVDGQAYTSQHVGNLEHYEARQAFEEIIADLIHMYHVDSRELVIVHDRHPQYVSTMLAGELTSRRQIAVQHHRAHIASVLAERQALDCRVLGIALDGTGYGDDGTIWGGELFVGSVIAGFERVAHLKPACLPGGDAAARHPVRAAAGFLCGLDRLPDLAAPPFSFPAHDYGRACALLRSNVRTFGTTSTGRLFDAVAALTGFTRPISFEGQAAMWLEHLAGQSGTDAAYPMPFDGRVLDWQPMLEAVLNDRRAGVDAKTIARAFHRGLALGVGRAAACLLHEFDLDTVVVSGGVAQNELFVRDLVQSLAGSGARVWLNHVVPPNDGGLSLGQAALAIPAAEAIA